MPAPQCASRLAWWRSHRAAARQSQRRPPRTRCVWVWMWVRGGDKGVDVGGRMFGARGRAMAALAGGQQRGSGQRRPPLGRGGGTAWDLGRCSCRSAPPPTLRVHVDMGRKALQTSRMGATSQAAEHAPQRAPNTTHSPRALVEHAAQHRAPRPPSGVKLQPQRALLQRGVLLHRLHLHAHTQG